jgi:hypothetical protein
MPSTEQTSNRKMEILVIGPEPPCVRCLNTHRFAAEVARQIAGDSIEVRRVVLNSDDAQKYGWVEGGHDIAKREKVKVDVNKLINLVGEAEALKQDKESRDELLEDKLGQIDEVLAPLIQKAEAIGSLMTPVLVINGKVKSSGYVPRKEQIREWILNELGGK